MTQAVPLPPQRNEFNLLDYAGSATIDNGSTFADDAFDGAIEAIRNAGAGLLVIPEPTSSYRMGETKTILPPAGQTQLFLDIEMRGRNGAIRFDVPNTSLFHTKGIKHSRIAGVRVQLGAAAANTVVWDIDGDATYQSTSVVTFDHCLSDFLGAGQNTGFRFGKSGGGRDFSVIRFVSCAVNGIESADGDTAVRNYSINGLGWHFDTCTFSGVHTGYADAAPTVTLNGDHNDSTTTIAVNSNNDLPFAVMPSAGVVQIDSEKIAYTGKGAASLTGCTRGYDGTSAASHTNGTAVRHVMGSAGPSGAASMTFTNQVNSNLANDFLCTIGGDYAIRGGRFENGKRFFHQYSGSSPISLIVETCISDYTPSDGRVFNIQHPGSFRGHLHATKSSGGNYDDSFIRFNHSGEGSLVLTGAIQNDDDPPYSITGGATIAHNLAMCAQLSDVNTVAGMFTE